MKLKLILYICFVFNILLFMPLVLDFMSYCETNKQECKNILPDYFIDSSLKEAEKRLIDNKVLRFSHIDPNKKKTKDAQLITANDTIYIKRNEDYNRRSEEEKEKMFAQSIMAWKGLFLHINDLDSIWNAMLKQENIYLQTGVKYRHRDHAGTVYSDKDSFFFKTAECLDEYTTGIHREISLHGYYKISFSTLYKYSPNKFNVLFLKALALLISLIVCYILIIKFTRVKLKPLAKPEEQAEYIRIKKSTSYLITDNITLDVERSLLWATDGRDVSLTPKMVEFLEELLTSPYFHALNTDLWKKIWNTEEDTSNVLTQLVSNLRDELRRFPELEVRNIRKKGYQLIIHTDRILKVK